MKDTVKKVLEDRKVVLSNTADSIRRSLVESDAQATTERKRLEEIEVELADIDDALNAPTLPDPSEE